MVETCSYNCWMPTSLPVSHAQSCLDHESPSLSTILWSGDMHACQPHADHERLDPAVHALPFADFAAYHLVCSRLPLPAVSRTGPMCHPTPSLQHWTYEKRLKPDCASAAALCYQETNQCYTLLQAAGCRLQAWLAALENTCAPAVHCTLQAECYLSGWDDAATAPVATAHLSGRRLDNTVRLHLLTEEVSSTRSDCAACAHGGDGGPRVSADVCPV